MALKFPEKIIILATVHGVIPVSREKMDVVGRFRIPEGMRLHLISTTRPGICSLTSTEWINNLINIFNKAHEENYMIKELPYYIFNSIINEQAQMVKNIIKKSERMEEIPENKKSQIIRSGMKYPSMTVYDSGESVVEKVFVRSKDEGDTMAFDFKLNIVNMPGIPDLFDILSFNTYGIAAHTRSKAVREEVYFSRIMDVLKNNGVKEVFFYDLTCSSFQNTDNSNTDNSNTNMSNRNIRRIRLKALQRGKGHRSNKNRTNRKRGGIRGGIEGVGRKNTYKSKNNIK